MTTTTTGMMSVMNQRALLSPSSSNAFVFKMLNITGGNNKIYVDNVEVLGALRASSSSGRIEISNMSSKVAVASVTKGRLLVTNSSSVLSVYSATTNGDVYLTNVDAMNIGNITVSTSEGKVFLTELSQAKFISATSSKGRITLHNSASLIPGPFSFKAGSRLRLSNSTTYAVSFNDNQPSKKSATGYIDQMLTNRMLQLRSRSGSVTVDVY